ncbi:MAG: Amino acid synthesis, partial [Actinomycetota bacterium]
QVPDAPRADEMVIALALSIGGRPHARTKKPS